MNISNKKKKTKRKILLLSLVVLIILLSVSYYLFITKPSLFGWLHKETDSSKLESEQRQAGDKIKQDSLNAEQQKSGISGSDQPPAPTPQPNGGKNVVEVNITAANQNDALLQIRTLILAVESMGTCSLSLQKNGLAPVTRTAPVQSLSSSSTCQGFDIPVSELAKGDWLITLHYESSALTGTTTKNVTIQ